MSTHVMAKERLVAIPKAEQGTGAIDEAIYWHMVSRFRFDVDGGTNSGRAEGRGGDTTGEGKRHNRDPGA
jgi:hypothetical protein